jgi:cbb3-type cytochrome oxidase maturation protein
MSAIFILIGFSLLAAVFFLFAFFWAIKSGQYDDAYTPSVRMLFDDDPNTTHNPGTPTQSEKKQNIITK